MRYGVKVEVDDRLIVEAPFATRFEEGLLESIEAPLVQGVRIGGQGRALGQDIGPGQQPHSFIEAVVTHVAEPFVSQEREAPVSCRRF